jgi:hypothetical protein
MSTHVSKCENDKIKKIKIKTRSAGDMALPIFTPSKAHGEIF